MIEEWVVDFLRPTLNGPWPKVSRQEPSKIHDAQRGVKYLINGSYPGPTLHANENDMMHITVVNNLFSEATTIHWHGIHAIAQPYMDGARDITQASACHALVPRDSCSRRVCSVLCASAA